jgi:hypothetical protein
VDISNFQIADEARPLKILHPETKAETDIVIFCISPDHPDYKNRVVEVARLSMNKAQNPNAGVAEKAIEAVESLIDKKTSIIAKMINGWEGISVNGKPFKYNEKNALKLVVEYPWIAEQVDRFCGNRANFFKGSSKA